MSTSPTRVDAAHARSRDGRSATKRAPPTASSSPRSSPARSPASPSPRSSRGCSRFNAPQGACPACDGLGEKLLFDAELVVPNHALSIKKGAVVPWAKSQPAQPLLHAGARQPRPRVRLRPRHPVGGPARGASATSSSTAPAASPSRSPSSTAASPTTCSKPFEGVIGNLNRRLLQTESAWMREELSQVPDRAAVRDLPRRAPQARGARGQDRRQRHRHATRLSVVDALAWFARPARPPHRPAERDRRAHPQGDRRAARLPQQRRARLPQPRPHPRHALGRREPAHPPRQPDRQRPVGRALRPRRAQHRPPPARQRPAARRRCSACATSATP